MTKISIWTVGWIFAFVVITLFLLGPYLNDFLKGTVTKWLSPRLAEGNAVSLALCDYKEAGLAEYTFQWSSKQDGLLSDVARGLADCEWAGKAATVSVKEVAECPAADADGLTAYLLSEPGLPLEEQFRFSQGNAYKVIAERMGGGDAPDVCLCVTMDLRRRECW